MPRMLRLESPGSLVHVMARGVNRAPIFQDDEDRHEFLRRFGLHRAETGYKCLAWCLMPNHYHLVLRMTEVPPSRLMRPLNGGYARWFNKKYGRRGYLYQDRYKSVLCQDMDYMAELIRYVHLNPIRAGLVPTLAKLRSWKWCGHGFLLGVPRTLGEGFQDRLEALRRFDKRPDSAVTRYMEFLAAGIDADNLESAGALDDTAAFEVEGSSKGWPAVIGDPEFARAAMERHEVGRRRTHRQADYGDVLEKLAKRVCGEHGLKPGDLFRRGRSNARTAARAQFCYRAHARELLPYAVIARFLGAEIPPVTLLARRAEAAIRRSDEG